MTDHTQRKPAKAPGTFDSSQTPMMNEMPDPGRKPWVRLLMQVLWPAFLGAAVTVGVVFSLIDPLQIEWVHLHLHDSRQAAYTAAFILFWILNTLVCSMTWYLAVSERLSKD